MYWIKRPVGAFRAIISHNREQLIHQSLQINNGPTVASRYIIGYGKDQRR